VAQYSKKTTLNLNKVAFLRSITMSSATISQQRALSRHRSSKTRSRDKVKSSDLIFTNGSNGNDPGRAVLKVRRIGFVADVSSKFTPIHTLVLNIDARHLVESKSFFIPVFWSSFVLASSSLVGYQFVAGPQSCIELMHS
jgi:hypothetical protein